MSFPSLALAVDVGGTSAKIALVDQRQRILDSAVIPTGRATRPTQFVGVLSQILQRMQKQRRTQRIAGVGIGIPGLVDVRRGAVRYLVNMPLWKEVPLKRLVERRLGIPATVDNDVNAMAWGQYRWGAGRGAQSLFCMTLGTGVGGGWVLEGRLYRGWTFSAGEIGHIPLSVGGPRCSCGGRGCLERYVGNREIVQAASKQLQLRRRGVLWKMIAGDVRQLTPRHLTLAARRNDPVARQAWNEAGARIGLALVAAVNLMNPERVVIGGGVAQAGNHLFGPIRRMVHQRAMRGPSSVRIVPARWGAQAGLIGAAAMVLSPESP